MYFDLRLGWIQVNCKLMKKSLEYIILKANISFLIITFLVVSIFTNAVHSQADATIKYPQYGLSFKIPENWKGQEGDGAYFIGHDTIPGVILIIPHSSPLTADQMITESSSGLQLSEGTLLKPISNLNKFDENSMGGEFEGVFDYYPAKAFIVGMSNPKGNGITIISMTNTDSYNSAFYKELAMEVKSSVVFSKVTQASTPNTSSASGTLKDWNYQLGNTKLTFTESYYSGGKDGGGYNMKEEIHLCKAGYFLYYDQDFISAGGENYSAYSGGSSKGHGSWKIIQSGSSFILQLSFHDGNSKEYSLAWEEGQKLHLNGSRYYRTWEGDYAPDCFR